MTPVWTTTRMTGGQKNMSRLVDTAAAIEAIFEKGCFRPLRPLPLDEGVQVRLRLEIPRSEDTLTALEDLVAACSELSEDQWRVFDEATARRHPFFRQSADSE